VDLAALINFLQFPSLPFNALDIIVLAVLAFYAYEGYTVGFLIALLDLLSFIISFMFALFFYGVASSLFSTVFAIPQGFANALGFFCIALVTEIVLNILLRFVVVKIPVATEKKGWKHGLITTNHWLGIVPGITSALIVLSFLFSVVIALPSSPVLKELVSGSSVGSRMIANTAFVEGKINEVFGGALRDTLTYLTIEPESNESIDLRFRVEHPIADAKGEQEMLRYVNYERTSRGLKPLVFNTDLQDLARDYSADMFRRGYFSHYTPDNPPLSPFDRMERAGIGFFSAGENLALAPTTKLAMQGLMNSPGHRANILSKDFGTIGIGVMDGGIYGKMYTQEFTD
jgi:uncharacterized protein YkwD/uncharacterized membrane protein required for colicin V production